MDFLQADRFDPSSQICSHCGFRWGKLSTNIRSITSKACGQCHLLANQDIEVDEDTNVAVLTNLTTGQSMTMSAYTRITFNGGIFP